MATFVDLLWDRMRASPFDAADIDWAEQQLPIDTLTVHWTDIQNALRLLFQSLNIPPNLAIQDWELFQHYITDDADQTFRGYAKWALAAACHLCRGGYLQHLQNQYPVLKGPRFLNTPERTTLKAEKAARVAAQILYIGQRLAAGDLPPDLPEHTALRYWKILWPTLLLPRGSNPGLSSATPTTPTSPTTPPAAGPIGYSYGSNQPGYGGGWTIPPHSPGMSSTGGWGGSYNQPGPTAYGPAAYGHGPTAPSSSYAPPLPEAWSPSAYAGGFSYTGAPHGPGPSPWTRAQDRPPRPGTAPPRSTGHGRARTTPAASQRPPMPDMPPPSVGPQPQGPSYARDGATPSGSSRTANPNSHGSSTRPQVNAVPRDWYVELNTDELSKGAQGEVKEDIETMAGDYYSFLGE
ncbi:hypothetical protein CALVIDRAFT_597075 [Calocera viscosa TUFC12733]|uniref:Uncharacterized protein n=1 Tax=Calocera viscosa (strain TUFC12733) TaxID=1330018 RepID=A0A167NU32_CALVF|nr:hypothetical protein CALVIDRAFT_597075 [Calocera viscosa TUFC12733]